MFRKMGMRRGAEAAPESVPAAPAAATPASTVAPAPAVGSEGNRFKMRERLFAFGDDFYVENASGGRVYWVDGKALRVRDTMTLYDGTGGTAATMKKALITCCRPVSGVDDASMGRTACCRVGLAA